MLRLYAGPVGDDGLRSLGRLTELEVLIAQNVQITDAGLDHLAGLKHLKHLEIQGNRVTDAGVMRLEAGAAETRNRALKGVRQACATDRAAHKLQSRARSKRLRRPLYCMRGSKDPFLVPKLCLGTQAAKLCFASGCRQNVSGREAELRGLRSQAELGNENAALAAQLADLSRFNREW